MVMEAKVIAKPEQNAHGQFFGQVGGLGRYLFSGVADPNNVFVLKISLYGVSHRLVHPLNQQRLFFYQSSMLNKS